MLKVVGSGLAILISLGMGCAADRSRPVVSPVRDETQAHLEAVIETAIRNHGFPAAAAAVITSKDVHAVAMGRRRADRPDQVTAGDRFGLGSNTKAVTATMLGALVERGVLRWDTTLAAAFPDLPMRPEYRAVTLRQILTHRAGLPPWTSAEAFQRALTFNTTDLASGRLAFATAVLSEPPVNVPGTETRYFYFVSVLSFAARGYVEKELAMKFLRRSAPQGRQKLARRRQPREFLAKSTQSPVGAAGDRRGVVSCRPCGAPGTGGAGSRALRPGLISVAPAGLEPARGNLTK